MANSNPPDKSTSDPQLALSPELTRTSSSGDSLRPGLTSTYSYSSSPGLSRTNSHSGDSSQDEYDTHLDRLTIFDFLDNLSLSTGLEQLQRSVSAQTEKVRRHQQRLKSTGLIAKDRVVDEWRRRLPGPDEQLKKYQARMRHSVDRLGKKWNDNKAVTAREKASFIAGVLNIFVSGYLVGAHPEWFHYWYTIQLLYFMPIRIWVFPASKRLFISTYCLAMGNNAVAIAMWRNSLVFHSLDKITRYDPIPSLHYPSQPLGTLFIHIMPCVTLHCLVHLLPNIHTISPIPFDIHLPWIPFSMPDFSSFHLPSLSLRSFSLSAFFTPPSASSISGPTFQAIRFPAVHTIATSQAGDANHYTLTQMLLWATIPYAVWQLSYHFLITVRRRDKIAAGRPTSFTWMRKSYANTLLGKTVLHLPDSLQEPAFMLIQYSYACITMLPCPLWFRYRWASAIFLLTVFVWSVYNGATYYIDIFGTRFQKELEALKRDVAKWQGSSPPASMAAEHGAPETKKEAGSAEMTRPVGGGEGWGRRIRGWVGMLVEGREKRRWRG
ncbi:hypothetical protein H2199_004056 [Coniosporium tulheliwenetii]|uniref:Uncharacterized protein n=1 Tax=Coniosporium tulheliwenetii TaxID=3383036 RepID=A0ACC2Z6K4_9PEZI|nr:hypothetical protein H2199_004056 [Cladosporium sp. JES 115]